MHSPPSILALAERLTILHRERDAAASPLGDAELDALERLISATQASSLEDASVQVMLALDTVEGIESTEDRERGRRLLRSALDVLAAETGLDLARYGADAYAPAGLNPWASAQRDFDEAVELFADVGAQPLPMDATDEMAQAATQVARIKPDVARTLWRVMAAAFVSAGVKA